MSKYYKDSYCVTHGEHPHVHYMGFDNFHDAWNYFTDARDMGCVEVRLFDTSERTPEHPAFDVCRTYARPLRIA